MCKHVIKSEQCGVGWGGEKLMNVYAGRTHAAPLGALESPGQA